MERQQLLSPRGAGDGFEMPEFKHRMEGGWLRDAEGRETPHDQVFVPEVVARMECPEFSMLDGLEQFAGASTFLAGFVLADFAGFEFSAWPAPILAEIYLLMMSFVVGNAVFCSVLSISVLLACKRCTDWDIANAMTLRNMKKKYLNREDVPGFHDEDGMPGDYDAVVQAVKFTSVLPWPLPPYPRPSCFTSAHHEDVVRGVQAKGSVTTIMSNFMIDGPLNSHGFKLFPFAVLTYLLSVSFSALRNHLVPWHFGADWDLPAFLVSGSLENGLAIEEGYDPEPAMHGWIALIGVPAMVVLYFGIPMCFFASLLLRLFR